MGEVWYKSTQWPIKSVRIIKKAKCFLYYIGKVDTDSEIAYYALGVLMSETWYFRRYHIAWNTFLPVTQTTLMLKEAERPER